MTATDSTSLSSQIGRLRLDPEVGTRDIRTLLQLACVWAAPVFLITYGVGIVFLAHFLPPSAPNASPAKIAALYQDHRFGIRAGMIVGLVSSTLLFPLWAIISGQIARIEGRMPVLAMMQLGAGVLLNVFFSLCSMIWITASYRADLDPTTLRMLHDFGWLTFVMVFPGYTLQMLCIALAAFMDKSENPTWPRWAGYVHLWVGLSGMGGGLAVFFKSGPFAWNGLIGFYIPVAVFAAWLIMSTVLLHRAIVRQAAERSLAA